ncbi:MAG TPA: hypothetical protein VFB12_19905 [Ktedonobacteraceae bacterium]|nr:hypothetical protein [Ktedonobacteraceae bacterium]
MAEQTTHTRKNYYFEDPFADLLFLYTLTFHAFKGSEIGECYAAAAMIQEGNLESWKAAWNTLAEQVEEIGHRAEAKGHRVSAREAYLRAVTYYRNVGWAQRSSDPQFQTLIEKYRLLFQKFTALSDPPIECVEIPYKGKVLPGYFIRPDGRSQKRPTIICGDNTCEVLYYWIAPPAIERGYNALVLDLPGIGLNSFNGIGFQADTETPVKVVIDYLRSRSDVDPQRIAVYGGGEGGGYIMTRAAANEHRIAACIVDPLVFDMEPLVPSITRNVLHASEEEETLGSIAAELTSVFWGLSSPESIKTMKADPRTIACPLLCLNDATDYPELLEQAHKAIESNPKATQHLFTLADGTRGYRQLDNFGLKHQVMFDWLDEIFG